MKYTLIALVLASVAYTITLSNRVAALEEGLDAANREIITQALEIKVLEDNKQ